MHISLQQQEMIKFLAGDKECYTVSLECSLDESLIDGGSLCVEACDVLDRLNGTYSRSTATPGNMADRSITQVRTALLKICVGFNKATSEVWKILITQ